MKKMKKESQPTTSIAAPTLLDDSQLSDVAGGLLSPSVTTAAVPWWFNNIIKYGNWRGIQ